MANNWQLMTTTKPNRRQTDKFDHIYFTDLQWRMLTLMNEHAHLS